MIIVGAIAGWLAGQIVRGFGFGLVWDIVIGIIGAFIGVWLLTQLGFVPFSGFIGSIINAVIGAVILLVIVGFIKR
ncbi:MAG: GlsB/YeaQ/YmgE family stress response membrane protein [Alphaproteobacteria bacterium]|nr:MAG: GlsB/YeaQ/YmgE family stress response membrane protein [Alphaproteobacteria bacterium]